MSADPALGFWLRYADAEGALHERAAATVTMLLPRSLQESLQLPEELAVTADPEVAREDGALLLAHGHPVLDAAARAVLERGDVGTVTLAWPPGASPSPEALIERIRDHVAIDHGRIDLTAELPAAGYLPVLRIGALVTYSVTLDDVFQERQEVWVDAVTGLPLPVVLVTALGRAQVSEAPAHRALPADRDAAGVYAQLLLEERSEQRLAALRVESRGAQAAETGRIEDYYRAALDGIERRRATAAADKRELLDARADATRAERERRLAEVAEKYHGSLDTRWFRVHELLVPAMVLPVVVRRGPREYPFSFTWLLHQHTVAPVRCPHCSAGAPLVAAKDRLGCASCLPKPVPPPAPALAPVLPIDERPPAHRPVATPPAAAAPVAARPAPATAAAAGPTRARPAARPDRTRATASRPASASRPTTPRGASPAPAPGGSASAPAGRGSPPAAKARPPKPAKPIDAARAFQDANKRVITFWEHVSREDRAIRRLVAPDSPASVAVRIWGPRGPAVAIGMAADEPPIEIDVRTFGDPGSGGLTTECLVFSSRNQFVCAVRSGATGHKQVAELAAGWMDLGVRLPPQTLLPWWQDPVQLAQLPGLQVELDPVAAALWHGELSRRGFPFLLRGLAAWWRVAPRGGGVPARDAPVVAASISRTIAVAAGRQVTVDAVAADYGADPTAVRGNMSGIRQFLGVRPELGW